MNKKENVFKKLEEELLWENKSFNTSRAVEFT